MSRSGNALQWSCWVVAGIALITMIVFAVTSIQSGKPTDLQWGEIGIFVGSVAVGLGGPYAVNRATFKQPETKIDQ